MQDALGWDALEQAGAIRRGELTSRALVEQAISAIEQLNPLLNAVVHRIFDKARDVAEHPADGPFRGVPLLVKDAVCHTAGDPFHVGMALLRDRRWTESSDTHLAGQFRRAGFVITGKTNTPELATAYTTEPVAYGPTRNPWDLRRSAGGSSGGSAAAVAAGMVAVAHGNDMGGSIRVPASECGVVGLKPTRGRTSLGPDFGEYWAMLTHEGVLTRTVRDTAATLDAVAGGMCGDPHPQPPPPTTSFAEVAGNDPAPLRIGVRTLVPVSRQEAHHDCRAAVDHVAGLLDQLGHRVDVVAARPLDDEMMGDSFAAVFSASVARDVDRWSARLGQVIREEDVEPRNWMLAERGHRVGASDYVSALEYLHGFARQLCGLWRDDLDVLLTPTVPEPPPLLGRLGQAPTLAEVSDLGQFTAPFNVTGQPAISLPLARNDDGLPIGVQLVGAFGREDVLLSLAGQLERAADWASTHPPISIWRYQDSVPVGGPEMPGTILKAPGTPGGVSGHREQRTVKENGLRTAASRGPRQQ